MHIPTRQQLISRQISFFTRTTLDGSATQAVLSEARLALVGEGAVAAHAMTGLADSGIAVTLICEAQFHARAAHGAQCVLAAFDSPQPALLDRVNQASLEEGWPWIPAVIESGAAVIGPAVIPRQTACYRCYELRRHANSPPQHGSADDDAGAPGPLAACAGALLALEAVRLVSRVAAPQSMGRAIVLDFFAPAIASHRVLRLPSCPACGYGSRRLPDVTRAGV
jgi:bacteriocin biosynthesis cyclodehydratase domain-containing protein